MPTSPVADDDAKARQLHASLMSWALTGDRKARTLPARNAARIKRERRVDPNNELDPAERSKRADYLERAELLELSRKGVAARKKSRALLVEARAAERALAAEVADSDQEER